MVWEIMVAVISGITALIGAIVAGMRIISLKIEKVLHEFQPNGGSSTRDQLNRLAESHNKLEERVDGIYTILIENYQQKEK